jgi:hypothetical protein
MESGESTNGSLANSKYAKYLTTDQIKEFDNQYKMLASLAKLINDNIEILKEQDTKVPDVFWGAGDGEDEYIYAWLDDAWDQFKDYVDSIGCEIDVRDGRSSPHVTFNCDFLYNLREELRGEYEVTVDDVAHAIFETRYGGYDDICTSVKDFDFEVDYNLEKYVYDDTRDAVQSTFDDFTFYNTTDYASTYEDIDRAIQALDYIDSFKNNATDNYRSWYVNNGYGGYADDDFDESVNRRRRYRKLVKEDIDDNYTNDEKDEIIDEKGLRHYLFADNYYSWDAWNFNKIIDALSEMDKKHKEFYRSGKKKNRVSKRNLHRYSMYVDALVQDADKEAGNPVKAVDYSEIFDEFPELEQDAKRIGLKTK